MIKRIQSPAAEHTWLQFPREGTGTQNDPHYWNAVHTVNGDTSSVPVGGSEGQIVKWYNAKLTADQLYNFSLGGLDGMSTTVTVYRDGVQVAQSVMDEATWEWSCSYTPEETDTYQVKIETYAYGGSGTLGVTPVPAEITPWVEQAVNMFGSTGFDGGGYAGRKYSLREQGLLVPNDLYVCGNNANQQLGMGENQGTLNSFTLNTHAKAFKRISASFGPVVALDQYGFFWAWGNYDPHGNPGSQLPRKIGDRNDWVEVCSGSNNSAAFSKALLIDRNGFVWKTQITDGVFERVYLPKRAMRFVRGLGGGDPGCFGVIDEEGSLWLVGNNAYGMFGFGNGDALSNFKKQVGTWLDASFGGHHMLAIKSNRTLWGAGYNAQGQLGQGGTTNSNSLLQIGSASNWVRVFAMQYGTFALNEGNQLYACGLNNTGQLGLNDKVNRSSLALVGTFDGIQTISGVEPTSIMLKSGQLHVSGNRGCTGLPGDVMEFTSLGVGNCIDLDSSHYDYVHFVIRRRAIT
mgnify:CR=1 FL=1|jgi:hypothetical protein